MKSFFKVIGIILIVLVVILGVTYLSFREPVNQLIEIFGEDDFTNAIGAIFKVNFGKEDLIELEENKYNFIRFQTIEEINENMRYFTDYCEQLH